MGIIYKATNNINNKVYIGQTIQPLNTRKSIHKYHALNDNSKEYKNNHFYNAIRKYGWENFSWEVIDTADTYEELDNKERYWINHYDSINNGYNIRIGGTFNDYQSDKFAIAHGSKPFLAYRTNGEFLGEFINKADFSRKYNIASTHVSDLFNGKYKSCNGIIVIPKEEFSDEILVKKLQEVRNYTYRPFIAINIKTLEVFGPFMKRSECQKALNFYPKSNHIGEILKGHRQTQNGYTFKFIDELTDKQKEMYHIDNV